MQPEHGNPSVELKLEITNEDTVFLDIDDSGKATVKEITREMLILEGDNPFPAALEQWKVECDESFSWEAQIPKEDMSIIFPFINGIQQHNL